MAKEPRTLIISCMKNEGPFILEWVAHNLAIGITDFLIYTNDCDDGTDAMWERLQALGIGQHRTNKILPRGVQKSALFHARTEELTLETDWHLVLDVDEFIAIKCGDGTLNALRKACPDATGFAMTWRCFGDGGNLSYQDALLTERFVTCAPQFMPAPPQAWGVKTLFQNNGLFARHGVHIPLDPLEDTREKITTVNGSGSALEDADKTGKWRSNRGTYGYDLVQLNHYAVRSVESYLVKRDRGRVNHMDHDQGIAYWTMMSHNQETDHAIKPRVPALRAELEKLLTDPVLNQLHNDAVAWHRAKIAELKKRPDFAELFDTITGRIAARPQAKLAA